MTRKTVMNVVVCATAIASALQLSAQSFERIAPRVPNRTENATAQVSPVPVLQADSNSQSVLLNALKGLVFVCGPDSLAPAGLPLSAAGPSGISSVQFPLLDDGRFTAAMAPFLGKSVSSVDLDRIKATTTSWLRSHGHPFTDVSIPPQKIESGVLQIVITEYRLGQIKVQGAKHFSQSLIRDSSGLVPGRTLRLDDLQTDLDRLNRNPFLTVDAVFAPGSQTGQTDVILNAKDRLPLRVYSGYDNLGVRSLGTAEYNAGINWGNLFGTGEILSYQFTQSLSGRSTSHSISDTISLPWGDQLLIFGSYGVQLPMVTNIFHDVGHSGQASVRYVRPLPRHRRFTQDVQLGYDFKSTDNNLEFVGIPVFSGQAEVDQFPVVYDASLNERFGQTAVQNLFVFSPGGITPDNTNEAVGSLVPGAKARYLYNRFLITQTMPLSHGWTSVSRATVQMSTSILPYSEQLGGGGVGSVRGYYTDTALGTTGTLLSQELRLPPFTVSKWLHSELGGRDKAQLGIFFDYARLRDLGPQAAPVTLSSAGFLARYSVSRVFDVQYDMGYRFHRVPSVPQLGAYGQVSLTGSF